MSDTITDDGPRNPEPAEDIFLEKIDDHLVVIGSGGNCLNPFRHNQQQQECTDVQMKG